MSLEQDSLTMIPEHNVEVQQLGADLFIVQGNKDILQIWMEINLWESFSFIGYNIIVGFMYF